MATDIMSEKVISISNSLSSSTIISNDEDSRFKISKLPDPSPAKKKRHPVIINSLEFKYCAKKAGYKLAVDPKESWMVYCYADFTRCAKEKRVKFFIAKPDSGSQGRGIFLFKDPSLINANSNMIVQKYLHKPYLIDGKKFDMRIYVLITSCDPLRIFLYKEGLGRFATESYKEPNYFNLNKNFDRDSTENKGSKRYLRNGLQYRTLTSVFDLLSQNGHDVDKIWDNIKDVIIKTILVVQNHLKRTHKSCFPNRIIGSSCFEVLGFDIMLDYKLRPWVLEVNHSPSFTCDAEIDFMVKEALISDTFRLLNIKNSERRKFSQNEKVQSKRRLMKKQDKSPSTEFVSKVAKEKDVSGIKAKYLQELEEYENENMGNFERIFPSTNPERQQVYENILSTVQSGLDVETASVKARKAFIEKKRKEDELVNLPFKRTLSNIAATPRYNKPISELQRIRREMESMSIALKRASSARPSLTIGKEHLFNGYLSNDIISISPEKSFLKVQSFVKPKRLGGNLQKAITTESIKIMQRNNSNNTYFWQ
ncbi:TTL-domain-containing protein [Rozella allomycis CSF55]|uniref:TTL-domain-containing protein n=1 Tax=Rozella allomycis (strain CSF55) TaxID=988480 RepID=A0A4V1J078_ROZAC|nr:TTL-domain-containing protein [Rozella allomycis CSF55]